MRLLIISLLVIFSSEIAYGASGACKEELRKKDRIQLALSDEEDHYEFITDQIQDRQRDIKRWDRRVEDANRRGDRDDYYFYVDKKNAAIDDHNDLVTKQRKAVRSLKDLRERLMQAVDDANYQCFVRN